MSKEFNITCDVCDRSATFDSEFDADGHGWAMDENIENDEISMIGEMCPQCLDDQENKRTV